MSLWSYVVPCRAESSSSVQEPCLLWSRSKPEQADIVAALNEAAIASGRQPGGLSGLIDKWQKAQQK